MSDALPLSVTPNLDQYEKLAHALHQACQSGDPIAVRIWASHWTGEHQADRIARFWTKFQKTTDRAQCALPEAQFFIARIHGFANWQAFGTHLEELGSPQSLVSKYEAAVDAIISGDSPGLETLLRENPDLATARSLREHRSTLLHYVSANGVEDFRQKTPANIVAITKLLLDAGADVNAESDAYGGRSTALGLTATSYHPDAAGVQLPLMELLIRHGAAIDGPDQGSAVVGCLHNGRGRAAEFLADHGARLDLEGAAGIGRLDIVQSFFTVEGSLMPSATQQQLIDGFKWACEFGRHSVVDFLLKNGIRADAKYADGATGLHWAAYQASTETVTLLLEHGALVDVIDERYHGTPLEWALYGWGGSPTERPSYYEVVAILARAGAKPDPEWFADDEDRLRAAARLRSDPRMQAALRGDTCE